MEVIYCKVRYCGPSIGRVRLKVPGLDRSRQIDMQQRFWRLGHNPEKLRISFNLTAKSMLIRFDPDLFTPEIILAALAGQNIITEDYAGKTAPLPPTLGKGDHNWLEYICAQWETIKDNIRRELAGFFEDPKGYLLSQLESPAFWLEVLFSLLISHKAVSSLLSAAIYHALEAE